MGRQKKYTDDQEKEIIELLRKGLRPGDIATKYNMHHSIIRYIKKVNCPDLISHNKRISDEVKAKALELILNDWLYKDIAVKLNISKTTVGDIAKKIISLKRSTNQM